MADYTPNKKLELPKSTEHYDVGVANKNNMVIDSELHKLELKNQSQDELLATKEALNSEIARARNKEDEINQKLDTEISRANSFNTELNEKIQNEINRAINGVTDIINELDNYLPIDGTAKDSEKLGGYEVTKVSSKIWGSIPRVDASGVMEVGKYIDFHESADDLSDFYIRVTAKDDGLYIGDKKIMVDGDESHFQAGETFRVKGDTPLAGYVTTGATAIFFTIPLPKSAEGRTVSVSCNTWRVRGVQGYIVNQVNMSDYLITTPEISGNLIKMHIRKKDLTEFDNAVNNTPVGVDGAFTITFS